MDLHLGARLTSYRSESRTPTTTTLNYDESGVFTPCGALVWKATDDWTVYASYADIFRPQLMTNVDINGDVLPPVVGEQYEIGVKASLLDGRLMPSIAYFDARDTNRPIGLGGGVYVAAGEVRSRGVDAVQTALRTQAPLRRSRSNSRDLHLLTGLVFDDTGDRLSPTHANNHGKRYRYYVSHRLKTGTSDKASGWRVPAGELERLVLKQAIDLLRNRSLLAGWLQEHLTSDRIEPGLAAADEMARSLAAGDSNQRRQILHLIFRKIALSPNSIHFIVDRQMLVHRLDGNLLSRVDASDDPQPFVIERKIAIKRRGVEARLVIDGPADNEPDSSLINLVARSHYYLDRLCDGSVSSIAELAEELSVHRADISRILPLAFLSPAVTDVILTGRQSADLTSRTLARRADITFLWSSQAAALGM